MVLAVKHKHPTISVIVPTYRRSAQLGTCLEALARLDYPRDRFEVVVVDDGSDAPLEETVLPFRDRIDVLLLTAPHAGPASSRNRGARHARGEFLAFTDDDCAPAAGWLTALAARFAACPDCAIGGRTLNALPDNIYSAATQALVDVLHTCYNFDPEEARFFASNNLALPADRFHALGGFDAGFTAAAGEDRDFCDRWLRRGFRMTYAPEAIVFHAHALTLRAFWRQHFNYGRGAFRYHDGCARRGSGRFSPTPPIYVGLLRHTFLKPEGRRSPALSALLLVSQIATVAGVSSAWATNH